MIWHLPLKMKTWYKGNQGQSQGKTLKGKWSHCDAGGNGKSKMKSIRVQSTREIKLKLFDITYAYMISLLLWSKGILQSVIKSICSRSCHSYSYCPTYGYPENISVTSNISWKDARTDVSAPWEPLWYPIEPFSDTTGNTAVQKKKDQVDKIYPWVATFLWRLSFLGAHPKVCWSFKPSFQ